MRLGDLDALKEELESLKYITPSYLHSLINSKIDLCIDAIDSAPTVEISGLPKIHYDRGFIAGYEKGKTERPKGEWIPIIERLPDKEGKCLVFTDYGDVTMDSFIDGIFVCNLSNVTHWKPLPKAPKSEA